MSIRGLMPPAAGQTTGMGGWIVVVIAAIVAAGVSPASARADTLLYRWEGDCLPYADDCPVHPDTPDLPVGGWTIFNACDEDCSESIEDGHFVLRWVGGSDIVNYHLWIARSPDVPPAPPFWVEWGFRSNTHLTNSPSCDGGFFFRYLLISDLVDMHGNAAISFDGNDAITGLDPSMFHTYRFETDDGNDFRVLVDGELLFGYPDNETLGGGYLQMWGHGSCGIDEVNEWDFVRYGRDPAPEDPDEEPLGELEQLERWEPFVVNLDPVLHADLDRVTVTFNQPNYVTIDDVLVEVADGEPPVVIATRRPDNGEPDTVEIIFDRPLPTGRNPITFTFFEKGVELDHFSYGTTGVGLPIPAVSAWGLIALVLAILTAGTLVFRGRSVIVYRAA